MSSSSESIYNTLKSLYKGKLSYGNVFIDILSEGALEKWLILSDEMWDENMNKVASLLIHFYEIKENYEKCLLIKNKKEISEKMFSTK